MLEDCAELSIAHGAEALYFAAEINSALHELDACSIWSHPRMTLVQAFS